jgi:hypothetical protein
MCLMAGTELRRSELLEYVRSVVDVFVQLGREAGKRVVTELELARTWRDGETRLR